MWWITIIADIALVAIGFLFCKTYYNKTYGRDLGFFSLSFLRTHEVLHGNIFGIMPNFSNFSYNILLKGFVTIVCILIVHFTDSLWLTHLYIFYLLITYWMFKNRLQHYNSQPEHNRTHIKPALVASFTLPFFHTLFLLLLYITYLLY